MNTDTTTQTSPTPQRKARKNRIDTRALLVQTGMAILTEKGFNNTGIDEVLRLVGVPKGSFYHYFASKEKFGEAVIAAYAEYFAAKFDRLLGNVERAPLDRLHDFIAEATHGMQKYDYRRGCLVGNLGQEMGGTHDGFCALLEAVLKDWQTRVAECLREAQAGGEIPADADVEALAEFFWIGWEGAVMRAKLTRNDTPLQRFAEQFFRHIVR